MTLGDLPNIFAHFVSPGKTEAYYSVCWKCFSPPVSRSIEPLPQRQAEEKVTIFVVFISSEEYPSVYMARYRKGLIPFWMHTWRHSVS
jgi:hypothetical protein